MSAQATSRWNGDPKHLAIPTNDSNFALGETGKGSSDLSMLPAAGSRGNEGVEYQALPSSARALALVETGKKPSNQSRMQPASAKAPKEATNSGTQVQQGNEASRRHQDDDNRCSESCCWSFGSSN